MNTLSLTGSCLLSALCLLASACHNAESEQMYTEKTLEDNAKLKQEIQRLKADMKSADNTAPETLEKILADQEAELKSTRDQEFAILQEYQELCKELNRSNAQRAQLSAALTELSTIFNQEIEQARKAKSNFSRNYEYLNH